MISNKMVIKQAHLRLTKIASVGDGVVVDSMADCANESEDRENLSIGRHSTIVGALHVGMDASIRIGEDFYLGPHARIEATKSVTIGNGVMILDHACLFDWETDDPSSCTESEWGGKPLSIGDHVWIGEGAYIPSGISVGKGAVITPHSVVLSDVPPYSVVSGNPAKVISMIKKPLAHTCEERVPVREKSALLKTLATDPSAFQSVYAHAFFTGKRYTIDGTDVASLMLDAGQTVSDRQAFTDALTPQKGSLESKKKKAFAGTTMDSLSLAVVRILTLLVGAATTMLLSRAFSLEVYGTYSQGSTVLTMAISFTIWGMLDAVNFFINGKPLAERQRYINTIFSIIVGVGGLAGVVILFFQHQISAYFGNPGLSAIIGYIAFRPLLNNVINALQVLYISIGKARAMAVRDIIASSVRLLFAYAATQITNRVETIFIGQLLLDIVIVEYLWIALYKEGITINPLRLNYQKVLEIFRFSIPMAMHSLIKMLLRDMDKLFIGKYEPTANYALYANASFTIPYDIISNAFLLVIFPILTRYFMEKQYDSARRMVSKYIQISYLTNITFSVAVLLVAKECVQFLFGEKYLPGTTIFVLYIGVDIIRTLNLSTVLSAKGWVKKLMYISIGTVVLNLILNYVMYWTLGFDGPAVATVICTLISTAVTFAISGRALQASFVKLISVKSLTVFLLEVLILGCVSLLLRDWLRLQTVSYFIVLVSVGAVFIAGMFILNAKKIVALFRDMNAFKL